MPIPHAQATTAELSLVQAVIGKEPGAWEEFVRHVSDFIYSCCSSVFSDSELEAEYLHIIGQLQAEDFAHLRLFDGRAPLKPFLAFKFREMAGRRVFELFKTNPARAWGAFQRFFNKLLDPVKKNDEDLYQEICLKLIDDNYRRIVSFDGRGNFCGYIRRVIDNICLDLRRHAEGRRRLPEAVQRLPELEQEIYRQIQWKGSREKDLPDILRDPAGNAYAPGRINEALARLGSVTIKQTETRIRERSIITIDSDGEEKEMEFPDFSHSPENRLLDAEQDQDTTDAVAALTEALAKLPPELALYVRLRYYSNPPKAPKEIARLMGRSEREIYKFRQDAILSLKAAFKARGFEKSPDLSV